MKVLFDHQIFHSRYGGASKYFVKLVEEFEGMGDMQVELPLRFSSNEHLENKKILPIPFSDSKNAMLKKNGHRITKYLNRSRVNSKLSAGQFDVFHPTNYATYHIGKTSKPTILTIYDMIQEKFSGQDKKGEISLRKKKLCEHVDLILAISKKTKEDLVEIFNIPPDRVKVTYLAGGFEERILNTSIASSLPERYVLFVGRRRTYKNFDRFLNAMIPILQDDKTLHLICTGPNFTAKELELFTSLDKGISERIIHRFSKDEDFYTYYNKALAFVFPTLYEGFGLPTLEALSADCPSILSKESCLPEIGGDASVYFDPYDEADISEKITEVIYDDDKRLEMIEKGRTQLQKFSWKKTAERTKEAYQLLV